jgi:hypothetical protein
VFGFQSHFSAFQNQADTVVVKIGRDFFLQRDFKFRITIQQKPNLFLKMNINIIDATSSYICTRSRNFLILICFVMVADSIFIPQELAS